MRASTLLLATWLIWITAKGRLSDYWKLATVSSADGGSSPGNGASHASPFPGLLPYFRDIIKQNSVDYANPFGDQQAGGW